MPLQQRPWLRPQGPCRSAWASTGGERTFSSSSPRAWPTSPTRRLGRTQQEGPCDEWPATGPVRQPRRHPRDPSAQERPPRWLNSDGRNPQMAQTRWRWLRFVGTGQRSVDGLGDLGSNTMARLDSIRRAAGCACLPSSSNWLLSPAPRTSLPARLPAPPPLSDPPPIGAHTEALLMILGKRRGKPAWRRRWKFSASKG